MRNLRLYMAALVWESLIDAAAAPDEADAAEGIDCATDAVDPVEVSGATDALGFAEVSFVGELPGEAACEVAGEAACAVAGEAACAVAEGGGWDFLELFEGLDL